MNAPASDSYGKLPCCSKSDALRFPDPGHRDGNKALEMYHRCLDYGPGQILTLEARSMANECNQALSNAEERTLLKWISHLTRARCPIAPSLAYDMAENIRRQRYQLSTHRRSNPLLRPLGKNWLDKFKSRYPEIQGV